MFLLLSSHENMQFMPERLLRQITWLKPWNLCAPLTGTESVMFSAVSSDELCSIMNESALFLLDSSECIEVTSSEFLICK